jgi:hypothetical protein
MTGGNVRQMERLHACWWGKQPESNLVARMCKLTACCGMVEKAWLERMCLDVSIFHLIFLLIESCDPCTETPLTFESSWEIHQAFDGIW